MTVAYRETPEDRALVQSFRKYNGEMIDLRWSGGWLTPDGEYYPVDYSKGVTHNTIAEEQGSKIWGSGSIITRPPIMRIFDIAEWMRITYFEGSSFCVELKGKFINELSINNGRRPKDDRRQKELLKFIKDYKDGFDSYYINDEEYVLYRDFVSAIENNKIDPKEGIDNTSCNDQKPSSRPNKTAITVGLIVLGTIIIWLAY